MTKYTHEMYGGLPETPLMTLYFKKNSSAMVGSFPSLVCGRVSVLLSCLLHETQADFMVNLLFLCLCGSTSVGLSSL